MAREEPNYAAMDAFFGIFGMTRETKNIGRYTVNRAQSGMMLDTDSFYLKSDEPKPDPRNYRGADWSEVG